MNGRTVKNIEPGIYRRAPWCFKRKNLMPPLLHCVSFLPKFYHEHFFRCSKRFIGLNSKLFTTWIPQLVTFFCRYFLYCLSIHPYISILMYFQMRCNYQYIPAMPRFFLPLVRHSARWRSNLCVRRQHQAWTKAQLTVAAWLGHTYARLCWWQLASIKQSAVWWPREELSEDQKTFHSRSSESLNDPVFRSSLRSI